MNLKNLKTKIFKNPILLQIALLYKKLENFKTSLSYVNKAINIKEKLNFYER